MQASEFLNKLQSLTPEKLDEVKGLGPILRSNLFEFTASKRFTKLVEKFQQLEQNGQGLNVKMAAKKTGKLTGKTIVITGSFEISREQIKELLESQGAKISSSISKNTSYLLCGDEAGSKLEKAKSLGVEIVTNYQDLI